MNDDLRKQDLDEELRCLNSKVEGSGLTYLEI